ncbi:MAG: LytTR family DNA-binding domain-containing protein [Rubrivivax sp.]|nr:LytTR family DNA-binding domain-containing protein [Rubrivivax sp.]
MSHAPTALIAEDEPLLAQALEAELARLWPELQVAARAGDGHAALEQALALKPTLCFFDIRMPGLSGLEVAQALAEEWPADAPAAPVHAPFPLLVFVTAYDQYALQAFDAQAVDYLVKPVEPVRLAACVQRLKKRLAEAAAAAAPERLEHTFAQLRALLGAPNAPGAPGSPAGAPPRLHVIQAGAGSLVHMVPVDQVLYFEAADKYLRVVTAEREHLVRLSLRELLPQLDAQAFWQVHRGLVVRAAAITTAQRDESGKVFLTLHGRPERLTASRLYAHLFKGM